MNPNSMKYFYILSALFLFACSKKVDVQSFEAKASSRIDEKQTCSFDITEFNMVKRPAMNSEFVTGKSKKNLTVSPQSSTTSTTSSPTIPPGVILLDFDGTVVSGTSWNVNGDINCAPANLTETERANVFQRVVADFSPFNITVTTDESVYNNANPYKRMRVIITETWEWYGKAGGVSFVNSFTWGDNTPCFVFSSLLNYDIKKIAEASSHEAGHTLGLRHQSTYDANGVKLSDYNWGTGSGEIGWAPIMGAAYNQNLSLWHNGPNSISSTTIQNDVQIIANVVGLVNDDYSNTTVNTVPLTAGTVGVINNSSDVDVFSFNTLTSKTITVVPQNVGSNNAGGNLDLVLYVYNNTGALITTIDDPSALSASAILPPGSYYVGVTTTDNPFTTRYGMLSKYIINVN
jgi:hypothetical protein